VFFAAPLADPAVQYAQDWWDKKNTEEYNYYECRDCANFVSQCLIAGGYSFQGASGLDCHRCFTYAMDLASWLNSNSSQVATVQRGGSIPSWVGPGCVAI